MIWSDLLTLVSLTVRALISDIGFGKAELIFVRSLQISSSSSFTPSSCAATCFVVAVTLDKSLFATLSIVFAASSSVSQVLSRILPIESVIEPIASWVSLTASEVSLIIESVSLRNELSSLVSIFIFLVIFKSFSRLVRESEIVSIVSLALPTWFLRWSKVSSPDTGSASIAEPITALSTSTTVVTNDSFTVVWTVCTTLSVIFVAIAFFFSFA